MRILKWAAVAVTALFALMNLGAALGEGGSGAGARVLGAVLFVAGAVAATGLATGRAWGRAAVVAVGAANILAAVVALIAGTEGAVVGLVVGGLCVVLGAMAPARSEQPVVA